MILQTIKDTFSSLLTDVGVVGWLVIGLYVVVFSMRILLKVIDFRRARINRRIRQRQRDINKLKRDVYWRRRNDYYVARTAYFRSRTRGRR